MYRVRMRINNTISATREHLGKTYVDAHYLSARWGISLAASYRIMERDLACLRAGDRSVRVDLDEVERYERERTAGGAR